MKRRIFSEEFRQAALARLEKETIADVAADLKLNEAMLYKWRRKASGKKPKKRKLVAVQILRAKPKKKPKKANGFVPDVKHAITLLRICGTAITHDVVERGGSLSNPIYLAAMQALNALEGYHK